MCLDLAVASNPMLMETSTRSAERSIFASDISSPISFLSSHIDPMHVLSPFPLSSLDPCTADNMTGLPAAGDRSTSKETTPERPLAQPPRLKSACEACHTSKVRCTGKQPCQRCATNGWECQYKLASRIGKPKGSRNKSTLRRLQLEAEQNERERTRKLSTASSSSSPLPPAPGTASSAPSSIGIGSPSDQTTPLSMSIGYPPWSWAGDADLWMPSSQAEISVQSALALSSPTQLASPPDPSLPYEQSTHPYGHMTSSAESIQTAVSSSMIPPSTLEEGRSSGMASYLGPDEGYDFPQHSPSLAPEPHSARASSPTFTWLSGDPLSGFDYGDPHWTAQPCACTRALSWQLTRVDQLRTALTINTTLRAFMYEANEAIYSIRGFLECHACDKDSSGLSLMATMLTNVNHLFVLTLHQSVDPLTIYMRNGAVGITDEVERLSSEAAIVRGIIQRWLSTCEQALGVVQLLNTRAQSQQLLAGSPQAEQPERPNAMPVGLWGLPDLESFATMLWRVKDSLALYVRAEQAWPTNIAA